MTATAEIDQKFLRDVTLRLDTLHDKTEKRAARNGLSAALTVLAREIRKETPAGKTKRLRRAVGKVNKRNRRAGFHEAKVGFNVGSKAGTAPHAHLVTLGTAVRFTGRESGYTKFKRLLSGGATPGGKHRGKVAPNQIVPRAVSRGLPTARAKLEERMAQTIQRDLEKGR